MQLRDAGFNHTVGQAWPPSVRRALSSRPHQTTAARAPPPPAPGSTIPLSVSLEFHLSGHLM